MENLDLAASFEAQTAYEAAVPFVNVAYEVIDQWGDSVPTDPRRDPSRYSFMSGDELQAMCDYQTVLDAAVAAVSNDSPSLREVHGLREWDELRRAAEIAKATFAVRGVLPEDREA